jgi:hypothetical protein
MIGQAAEAVPSSGRIIVLRRPRDPNVEGPGGFFFGGAQAPGGAQVPSDLTFVASANGAYRFSFSPCDVGRAES